MRSKELSQPANGFAGRCAFHLEDFWPFQMGINQCCSLEGPNEVNVESLPWLGWPSPGM